MKKIIGVIGTMLLLTCIGAQSNISFSNDQDGKLFSTIEDCVGSVELINSASYLNDPCSNAMFNWSILVDVYGDGIYNYEYSSFIEPDSPISEDFNNNGILDEYIHPSESGEEVSFTLPIEIEASGNQHRVSWTVSDNCGNEYYRESTFMVVDRTPPFGLGESKFINYDDPYIVIENGIEYYPAHAFITFAMDNCDPTEELLYSYSGTTYIPTLDLNCDYNQVTVWIWDQTGNNFPIEVSYVGRDGFNEEWVCEEFYSYKNLLTGTVASVNGDTLLNGNVNFKRESINIPNVQTTFSEYSDASLMTPILSLYLDYVVSCQDLGDYSNGVTAYDLFLIEHHLSGNQEFEHYYQYLAADADLSNDLNQNDIKVLQELIIKSTDTLANGQSWRYHLAEQVFNTVAEFWSLDTAYQLEFITGKIDSLDFTGIKIGDLNLDASVTEEIQIVEPLDETIIRVDDKPIDLGEVINIPFTLESQTAILAFQVSIDLGNLEFNSIESELAEMGHNLIYNIDEKNVLSICYHATSPFGATTSELFRIEVRSRATTQLVNEISIHDKILNRFYRSPDAEKIKLSFDITNDTEAIANIIDPYMDGTFLNFSLDSDQIVELKLFSIDGKLIHSTKNFYGAGTYREELILPGKMASSVYMAVVMTKDYSKAIKFVHFY